MTENATATPIVASNTPVAVAGTSTISSIRQRFDLVQANNSLMYTSNIPITVVVSINASVDATNNDIIGTYVAVKRNGNPINPPSDIIPESEVYTTMSGTRPDAVNVQALITIDQ